MQELLGEVPELCMRSSTEEIRQLPQRIYTLIATEGGCICYAGVVEWFREVFSERRVACQGMQTYGVVIIVVLAHRVEAVEVGITLLCFYVHEFACLS